MEQETFVLEKLHIVIFHNENKISFINEEKILHEINLNFNIRDTDYFEKVITLEGKDYMFIYEVISNCGDVDINIYEYDKPNDMIMYDRPYIHRELVY